MAFIRNELIERGDWKWEAPVYEMETDEGPVDILGWDGMDEDPDNSVMPWTLLSALTSDGEEKYVAVPNKAVEYLSLRTEAVGGDDMSDEDREALYNNMSDSELEELAFRIQKEQKRVWRAFCNYGDDWEGCAFPEEAETVRKNLDFNLRDEMLAILQNDNAEVVKIGDHCLQLADRKINGRYFFGDGPEWSIGSVLQPYREFMNGVIDTIRKNTACYVDGQNGRVYPVDEYPEDAELPKYRIEVGSINIEEADIEGNWDKAADDSRKISDTITHTVTGTVAVYRRDDSGEWYSVSTCENCSLADIPAMNMGNGRFKKNGSIYSVANKAFDGNTKLKTAGMTMRDALEVGIYDFLEELGSRIAAADFTKTDSSKRLAAGLNMNSGFREVFLNARGDETDAEDDLVFLSEPEDEKDAGFGLGGDEEEKTAEGEDENLTEEEKEKRLKERIRREREEAKANELKTKLSRILRSRELKYTRMRRGFKGSAMYDNENNPFPRAQMTVRFDEKMNDPTLLQNYIVDPSCSPEGKNAPKVGRMLSLIRVGMDGTVYKPVLTLDQLKDVGSITPESIRWINAFEAKGEVDKGALEYCYYIRAGLVNEDGTLRTENVNGREMITAQLGENWVLIDPYHADRPVYIGPDPRCDHTAGTEQSGLPQSSKEVRTEIKTSNMKDATTRTETQLASLIMDREPAIGEELITRAKGPGIIGKIEYGMTNEGKNDPVSMTVNYDDGASETVDLRWRGKLNSKNAKRQQPCPGIREGVRVRKGQPLTDAPGVSLGSATLGPPLVVLIGMAPCEFGTDDSVYLSKHGADVLGAPVTEKQREEIVTSEAGSPFGPTFIFNPAVGQDSTLVGGRYDCSKLGPDGIIRDGETVSTGDIIAYMAVPNGSKTRGPGEQMAMERPKPGEPFTPPSDYRITPVKVRKGVVNARVTVRKERIDDGRGYLDISYMTHIPLTTGGKISFDGVKATVHVAEEKDGIFIHAPGSKFDGVEVDVVETANSSMQRSTFSFLITGLIQRAAVEKGVKIDLGVDSANVTTAVMNYLEKNGFGDGTVEFYGSIGGNRISEANRQRGLLLVVNGMNVQKNPEIIKGETAVTNSPMVEDSVLADGMFTVRKAMVAASPSRNGSIAATAEQAATVRLGVGTLVYPEDTRDHYNPWYVGKDFGKDF